MRSTKPMTLFDSSPDRWPTSGISQADLDGLSMSKFKRRPALSPGDVVKVRLAKAMTPVLCAVVASAAIIGGDDAVLVSHPLYGRVWCTTHKSHPNRVLKES